MRVAAMGGSSGRRETIERFLPANCQRLSFCGDPQEPASSSPSQTSGSSGNPGPTLPILTPNLDVRRHPKEKAAGDFRVCLGMIRRGAEKHLEVKVKRRGVFQQETARTTQEDNDI